MTSFARLKVPPPENWADFEDLCWGLWKVIWNHEGTEKNGRNGQSQNGVDIFGRPQGRPKWAGIQCKGKDCYTNQKLTKKEMREECNKAKCFDPELSEYAIATTAPRDELLQSYARRLSDENIRNKSFSFDLYEWNDIVDRLYEHRPPIASFYYPRIFGSLKPVCEVLIHHIACAISSPPPPVATMEMHSNDNRNPEKKNLVRTEPTESRLSFERAQMTSGFLDPELYRRAVDTLDLIHKQIGYQARDGVVSSGADIMNAINTAISESSANNCQENRNES